MAIRLSKVKVGHARTKFEVRQSTFALQKWPRERITPGGLLLIEIRFAYAKPNESSVGSSMTAV